MAKRVSKKKAVKPESCRICGGRGIVGDVCPSCGKSRPEDPDDQMPEAAAITEQDPEPPEVDGFESPESSIVMRGSYDRGQQTMLLTLKRGAGEGSTYRYTGIPGELWDQFSTAASKGTFFSMRIRPMYAGRLV